MLVSFMSLAVRSPWALVKNTFSFVSSWWRNLGPELAPAQQVDEFAVKFNKKYDEVGHFALPDIYYFSDYLDEMPVQCRCQCCQIKSQTRYRLPRK